MNKLDILKNFPNTIDDPTFIDLIILKDFVGDEKILQVALYILKDRPLDPSVSIEWNIKKIGSLSDPKSNWILKL